MTKNNKQPNQPSESKQKQTVYLNRKNYPETIDAVVVEAKRRKIKSLSNTASILISERLASIEKM